MSIASCRPYRPACVKAPRRISWLGGQTARVLLGLALCSRARGGDSSTPATQTATDASGPGSAPRRASRATSSTRCASRSSAICTSTRATRPTPTIYGTKTGPRDAYDFARGGEIAGLGRRRAADAPVPASTGRSTSPPSPITPSSSARSICARAPGSPVYDIHLCSILRQVEPPETQFASPSCSGSSPPASTTRRRRCPSAPRPASTATPPRSRCGRRCRPRPRTPTTAPRLQLHQLRRLRAHASRGGRHLHRNVIFRNEHVPPFASSQLDTAAAASRRACGRRSRTTAWTPARGCDALIIPHNPNLSGGQQFFDPVDARRGAAPPGPRAAGRDPPAQGQLGVPLRPPRRARRRHRRRALHLRAARSRLGGARARRRRRSTTTRAATWCATRSKDGLGFEATLGANPFSFGFVGSTDTHNGTPGNTDESAAAPACRATTTRRRSARSATTCRDNPGGLAGVWAEENSRDAHLRRAAPPRDLRHQRHPTGGALLRRRARRRDLRRRDFVERAYADRDADGRRHRRGARRAPARASPSWRSRTRAPRRAGHRPAAHPDRQGLGRRRRRRRTSGRSTSPATPTTAPASTPPPARRRRRRRRAVHGVGGSRLRADATRLLLRARAREPDLPLEHLRVPGRRRRSVRRRLRRAGRGGRPGLRRLLPDAGERRVPLAAHAGARLDARRSGTAPRPSPASKAASASEPERTTTA